MYVGMDFDAAFLLARFRMPSHTLEDEVGEQCDGCRIQYLQTVYPFRHLSFSAVRGKFVLIGGIQVPICKFKDTFTATGICIGERGTARHHLDTQMGQLARFRKHRVGYLTQGVETFDYGIEHDDQMLPCIEVLHITFSTVCTAETKNFRLVKQRNQLTIHRLSDKMSIFVHDLAIVLV